MNAGPLLIGVPLGVVTVQIPSLPGGATVRNTLPLMLRGSPGPSLVSICHQILLWGGVVVGIPSPYVTPLVTYPQLVPLLLLSLLYTL